MALATSLAIVVGCASQNLPLSTPTALPTTDAERERLCAQVFRTLGDGVAVGNTATDFKRLQLDQDWFNRSRLEEITIALGFYPIDFGDDNDAFVVFLYPSTTGHSNYALYFVLSSSKPDAADGAIAFFEGTAAPSTRLTEYALCSVDIFRGQTFLGVRSCFQFC